MTRQETAQVLGILRAAYPNFYRGMNRQELDGIVSLWLDVFGAYPAGVVAAAVKALIAADSKGFPPHIGAVMGKVRLLTEPEQGTEQEAWDILRAAICKSGYDAPAQFAALPEDIRAVVHSPSQLHAWAIDDGFSEAVVSSNFMRAYRSRMAQKREIAALPEDVRAMLPKFRGEPEPEQLTAQERRQLGVMEEQM